MRRRTLLAGLGTAGALAVGGARYVSSHSRSDGASSPVTVETIDAPGSEAGTTTVPPSDGPLLLEFFATTCSVCADQMSVLRTVRERAANDVRFLSVTSEPVGLSLTKGDVRIWWRQNGGAWPVGVDDGTDLAQRYGATRVPTTLVIDERGRVTWRHDGRFDAAAALDALAEVDAQ